MAKGKKKAPATAEAEESTPLSERLELQRTNVICGPEMNYHVHTQTSALAYMACGYDNSWQHDKWADNLRIEVNKVTDDMMEFELIGIDPALANAFRRVLISEVPTVCIESVFIVYNTSIMQEEVLSHRLGLVPLAVDPDLLQFKSETADETNTIIFNLNVKCTRGDSINRSVNYRLIAPVYQGLVFKPDVKFTRVCAAGVLLTSLHLTAPPGGCARVQNKDGSYNNEKVFSSDLKWRPEGSQYTETATRFVSPQDPSMDAKPVHKDILLCKLRPGQEIQLEAHAVKGLGEEHSKWSPVSTAWYRMHPDCVALKEVPEQMAIELAQEVPSMFSVTTSKAGKVALKIEPARKHEDVLEKVRHLTGLDKYGEYIQVRKRKEHFIFTIESVGSIPPAQLFIKALDILRAKCDALSEVL